MKLVAAILLLAGSTQAFAPVTQKASFITPTTQLHENKVPFFAASEESSTPPPPEATTTPPKTPPTSVDEMTEEEEVEMLVQAEVQKTQRISNLRNANGVDYAPWMNISADDEEKIRQLMKERTAARRARQEQEKSVSGNLYLDSQAQEISGTGLKTKIVDGAVELEWATKSEKDTKGFVVKRRPAKTEVFTTIATYETWGPLASQGADGGIYRYFDEDVTPGGWVYRVAEADNNGSENDICQCLVEIQTPEEQRAGLIAGVGIGVFAIAAFVGGALLDPMNGY